MLLRTRTKTQVTTMSNIWLTRSKASNSVFHPPFSITNYMASQHATEETSPSCIESASRASEASERVPRQTAAEPQQGDETRTFAASSRRFSAGARASFGFDPCQASVNSVSSQQKRSR
jgi:hypothetical protein